MCPCIIIICVTTAQVKEFNIPSTQCYRYKFLTKYDNSQRKPSIHPSSIIAGAFSVKEGRTQDNLSGHSPDVYRKTHKHTHSHSHLRTIWSRHFTQPAYQRTGRPNQIWTCDLLAVSRQFKPLHHSVTPPPSTNHLVLNKTVKGVTVIFHSLALHYGTCKAKKNRSEAWWEISIGAQRSNIERTSSCTKVQFSRSSVV